MTSMLLLAPGAPRYILLKHKLENKQFYCHTKATVIQAETRASEPKK